MVWKTMVSPLKFKLEGNPTLETLSMNPQSLTSTWEDIVFDFSTLDGNYPVLSLMPDFADPFETAEDIDLYIDNIQITDSPNPISGIWNNKADDLISLYPNPCTNEVSIDLTRNMKSVVVRNMMGQVVYSMQNVSKGIVRIDASFMNKGMYFVTLTDTQNVSASVKLLKN
jgi:hypothetical protein